MPRQEPNLSDYGGKKVQPFSQADYINRSSFFSSNTKTNQGLCAALSLVFLRYVTHVLSTTTHDQQVTFANINWEDFLTHVDNSYFTIHEDTMRQEVANNAAGARFYINNETRRGLPIFNKVIQSKCHELAQEHREFSNIQGASRSFFCYRRRPAPLSPRFIDGTWPAFHTHENMETYFSTFEAHLNYLQSEANSHLAAFASTAQDDEEQQQIAAAHQEFTQDFANGRQLLAINRESIVAPLQVESTHWSSRWNSQPQTKEYDRIAEQLINSNRFSITQDSTIWDYKNLYTVARLIHALPNATWISRVSYPIRQLRTDCDILNLGFDTSTADPADLLQRGGLRLFYLVLQNDASDRAHALACATLTNREGVVQEACFFDPNFGVYRFKIKKSPLCNSSGLPEKTVSRYIEKFVADYYYKNSHYTTVTLYSFATTV